KIKCLREVLRIADKTSVKEAINCVVVGGFAARQNQKANAGLREKAGWSIPVKEQACICYFSVLCQSMIIQEAIDVVLGPFPSLRTDGFAHGLPDECYV